MICSFCKQGGQHVVSNMATAAICVACVVLCGELLRAARAGEVIKSYERSAGVRVVDPPEVRQWPAHGELLKRSA